MKITPNTASRARTSRLIMVQTYSYTFTIMLFSTDSLDLRISHFFRLPQQLRTSAVSTSTLKSKLRPHFHKAEQLTDLNFTLNAKSEVEHKPYEIQQKKLPPLAQIQPTSFHIITTSVSVGLRPETYSSSASWCSIRHAPRMHHTGDVMPAFFTVCGLSEWHALAGGAFSYTCICIAVTELECFWPAIREASVTHISSAAKGGSTGFVVVFSSLLFFFLTRT